MKTKFCTYIRYGIPGILLILILLCRFLPGMAEGYARYVYPYLSAIMSGFSSLFFLSLEEVLVVAVVLWLIVYPIRAYRKKKSWKRIWLHETEIVAWVYIWFYLGWGLNYFRYNIYERAATPPAEYNEQAFRHFLTAYTDSLNSSYLSDMNIDQKEIGSQIKEAYRYVPASYGLAQPKDYQHPKYLLLNPVYSGVGVLGYMGPFFSEFQLNNDLLPVQIPFSYAHELSHLLGVSNEAEANYWAYQICTHSALPAVRYSGYFGLLPYVLANASMLLPEAEFQEWVKTIRPEIVEDYEQRRNYWSERYNPLIGEIQNQMYNLFLKGNNIPSGRKNYAEVVGIILSLGDY